MTRTTSRFLRSPAGGLQRNRPTCLLAGPCWAVPLPAIAVLAACVFACNPAGGTTVTLFSETFDGYTSFPSQVPAGDCLWCGSG